jgi:hypothetical protein
MAAHDPLHRHLSARIGAIAGRNADDPRLPGLRRRLEVVRLAEHIRRAPPLTAEERRELVALLRPGGVPSVPRSERASAASTGPASA